MPDIKAEVNKVDDGKKKGAGLFGLFGGGGGSAAGGLGGLGAGAAGGGGLLATKAGMLALVLIGTSVAGGIGVAGYKLFGPGEADKTGGNFSLFAPKPPQAADASAGAVSADGSSQSLTLMAQSAAKDREADASASAAAPTDAVAGDAAGDASGAAAAEAARREAEARAAAAGAINKGGGAGAVGSMSRGLTNTKPLGALSGATGGGASTTASSGPAGKLGENLAAASRNSATSGFSRSGPGAKASGAKGRAARGGRGARAQARNVMGDQAGGRAGSSFAAGRTYDGSATQAGGAIGPDGGAIGMDGVGDGAGAQPKELPRNSAANSREEENIPPPTPKDVTPWAKEMMVGLGLGVLAIGLLYAAKSMIETAKTEAAAAIKLMASTLTLAAGIKAYEVALATLQWAKIVVYAALAAAAGGLIMGGMIAGGDNGQVLQGGLLIASSAAIAAIGATYLITASKPPALPVADDPESIKAASDMAAFSAPPMWMTVIGGAAAIGLVGTMLAPKKTCKSDEEGCQAHYQQQAGPTDYTV
ncbi:MAG: hypothetical protein Q8T11_11220 [Elusimicrobiota bacterium]|nr:hypothetical protein [Elusimicrobiota bacterium]